MIEQINVASGVDKCRVDMGIKYTILFKKNTNMYMGYGNERYFNVLLKWLFFLSNIKNQLYFVHFKIKIWFPYIILPIIPKIKLTKHFWKLIQE